MQNAVPIQGVSAATTTFENWQQQLERRRGEIVALIGEYRDTRQQANRDMNHNHFPMLDFESARGEPPQFEAEGPPTG